MCGCMLLRQQGLRKLTSHVRASVYRTHDGLDFRGAHVGLLCHEPSNVVVGDVLLHRRPRFVIPIDVGIECFSGLAYAGRSLPLALALSAALPGNYPQCGAG